ncbi:hypothetical protein D3C83_130860 [compost metagenome]
MQLHDAAHVGAHIRHALSAFLAVEPREARLRELAGVLRQCASGRAIAPYVADDLLPGGLAEHQQVEQRIASQAIGPMHRNA